MQRMKQILRRDALQLTGTAVRIPMNDCRINIWGIDRLRMATDGTGVTTIVGSSGCPLGCKYCINPEARDERIIQKGSKWLTPQELLDKVKIDDLYFRATNGGVTFGGGEPLIYADFIWQFSKICPKEWNISVETSLHVSEESFVRSLEGVDAYIVDIKDMNPDIYYAYTGQSIDKMLNNLKILSRYVSSKNILIRVPLIKDYNSKSDTEKSVRILKEMGFDKFNCFTYVIR